MKESREATRSGAGVTAGVADRRYNRFRAWRDRGNRRMSRNAEEISFCTHTTYVKVTHTSQFRRGKVSLALCAIFLHCQQFYVS